MSDEELAQQWRNTQIKCTPIDGYLAGLRAGREQAAEKCDEKAAECRKMRVTDGDMQRNYFGGGMAVAEELAAAIRGVGG